MDIKHPWLYLQQELTKRWRTQKGFAKIIGKSASEVNELIKWKRNITPQRDLLLAAIFDSPAKKRMTLQMEYDYEIGKSSVDQQKILDIKTRKKDVETLKSWSAETLKSWQVDRVDNKQDKQEPVVNTVASPKESTTITDTKAPEWPKPKHREHEIFRNF